MRELVQIAGVRDEAEARMLTSQGVDWLGFPLRLACHQPDTTEAEARRIIEAAGLADRAVLITYLSDPDEIGALSDYLGVRRVQLHGEIAVGRLRALKSSRPDLYLIKSLIVAGGNLEQLLSALESFGPAVDAFITDTFDPRTGACGATGRTHDWAISAALAARSERPLILAGGLTPDNVAEAIRTVRPAGVDAHTGVEGSDGRKDPARVRAFVAAARQAFRATRAE